VERAGENANRYGCQVALPLKATKNFASSHAGHLEVEHHRDRPRLLREPIERFEAVLRHPNFEALVLKHLSDRFTRILVIVDQQHRGRHVDALVG